MIDDLEERYKACVNSFEHFRDPADIFLINF